MIAQYAPSGSRQAFYVQSLARIDELLSVTNTQGKYWYETDALGSVYTLTTSTGAVQARGGYDVFGEPVGLGGTAIGQPFGFTGREHEADSGLVYARNRFAAPMAGQWTQPDRLGRVASPNLYLYVNQQPTRLVDPTGDLPVIFLPLFGAAVGGILGLLSGLWQGGLTRTQLIGEFVAGAMIGAMAVYDVISIVLPWMKMPILAAAISNALFAALGNVAAQVIASGSVQSWPSVALSALMFAAVTLLAGAGRFGLRGLARDLAKDIGMPVGVKEVFTLVPTLGGAQFDFILQTLLIPAFYHAQQKATVESYFSDEPVMCLPT